MSNVLVNKIVNNVLVNKFMNKQIREQCVG